MIKLIVTDIDGTILKKNFEFNQEVKDCIKDLTKRGIKVVPHTCSCCYRQECSKKITCMDEISVEEVLTAIYNL